MDERPASRPRRPTLRVMTRDAFTLIELLVVIAIIAFLISILLVTLRSAREAGRSGVCLSNLRQLGVAWQLYIDDWDNFPVANNPDVPFNGFTQINSWGGIDFFRDDDQDQWSWLIADRPINLYISGDAQDRSTLGVFRCPSDDGMRGSADWNEISWYEDFGHNSMAEDAGDSIFSMVGTSYSANDWLYCTPGSQVGWDVPGWTTYREDLGPNHVETAASRLVLIGDFGGHYAGRYTQQEREDLNFVHGWWHGHEACNLMFLDGSARRETMGAPTTPTYTIYLAPDKHGPGSYRRCNHY